MCRLSFALLGACALSGAFALGAFVPGAFVPGAFVLRAFAILGAFAGRGAVAVMEVGCDEAAVR